MIFFVPHNKTTKKPEDNCGETDESSDRYIESDLSCEPMSQKKGTKSFKQRSGGRNRKQSRSKAENKQGSFNVDLLRPVLPGSPVILSRSQHCLSRKNMDPDALKVLRRLNLHGYQAFLVGGSVRDLLLGRRPKDFDVATDARPEAVSKVFRNSRIIGRRFRLNQVYFHRNKIIEVSTFRSENSQERAEGVTTLALDNTFGDPQTDARRRDLTINGLFYDLRTFSVIDYVGGIRDLEEGVIRVIGDPEKRFKEDPVRMIRVIRHAARTGFRVEEGALRAIEKQRKLLTLCSSSRLTEEFFREIHGGFSRESINLMHSTGLLKDLLPQFSKAVQKGGSLSSQRLDETLGKIDRLVKRGVQMSTAVILAGMLVGKIPEAVLAQLDDERDSEVLRDYWRSSPWAVELAEPQGELEIASEVVEPSKEQGKSRSREFKVTKLGKQLVRFLQGLTIAKRDRAKVEQLLTARRLLLTTVGKQSQKAILNRSYFNDALLLLQVTAHESVVSDALKYWNKQWEQKKQLKQKKVQTIRNSKSLIGR